MGVDELLPISPLAVPPCCLISLRPFSTSLPNCWAPGMSCPCTSLLSQEPR